ncbi:hypothetical protein [Sinorhizobium fredii]|uniref:hypothetical protein n=1 Tax=Rhizobium fredii TaxID=380 RepID=UPI0006887F6C|nr:hypothetical protein [Sinorhizobium fredii]
MTKLDKLYGPCLPPGKPINQHELDHLPRTLQRLDENSAPLLIDYLARQNGLFIPNAFPVTCHVLWVVDEPGEVWFSSEEIIQDDGELIGILPKKISARPKEFIKLGHPSLLTGNRFARLGGELVYDPVDGVDWCITNSSGRYGLREHQKAEHLEAVAGKFAQHGLHCWTHFEPPLVEG